MNLPPTSSGGPASDRRAVPRHLRDTEHQDAPDTPGSGMRRGDVPARHGVRGTVWLVIGAAALAVGLWLGVNVPLGVASLCLAAVAGVLASLGFRRR